MDNDRGQLERLTFFSDAVFAIAMTLLVIEVHVPEIERFADGELGRALLRQFPRYIGFLTSFLVVGRFWIAHHRTMGMLKAQNPRLVWANLMFLLVVAFMPFPTAVLSEYVQLRVGVGFYAACLVLLGVMNRLVTQAAFAGRTLVRDDIDEATCRDHLRGTWISIIIGVLAFVGGMIAPLLALVALIVGSPIVGYLIRRRWSA